jgi:hypothetical protein
MNKPRPLAVGDVIHGFAQGGFGRDHYDCVRIEAAGRDWIVARDAHNSLSFAGGERDLRHLLRVRDEDADKCPEDECPVRETPVGLTFPGGPW